MTARGRPRIKPYMRLQSFVAKSRYKYVSPFKLKPDSEITKLLWCILCNAFKEAIINRYESTGLTWENKKGASHYSRRFKGEFLRCRKCGAFDSGANVELTVDVRHNPPRIRIPRLVCGHPLELRLKCPFCGGLLETSKTGGFRCSKSQRCFSLPLDEVEEAILGIIYSVTSKVAEQGK